MAVEPYCNKLSYVITSAVAEGAARLFRRRQGKRLVTASERSRFSRRPQQRDSKRELSHYRHSFLLLIEM